MSENSVPEMLCVDLRGLAARPADAIRVMIVGDVLRRLSEHRRATPLSAVTLDDARLPTAVMRELGILPSAHARSAAELGQHTRGARVLTVAVSCPPGVVPGAEHFVRVGEVGPDLWQQRAALASGHHELLAVKLALLRFRHADPVTLSEARLRRASQTLDRWRLKVAAWKDLPATSPTDAEPVWTYFGDDLRSDRVLREMHRLEGDNTMSSGAKYRAFSALDEILALDLHRKCGYGLWWHG